MELPIDDIRVGPRHRRDHGDLDALAGSIEDVGLLQPIGVTPDLRLVFGERRLRAFKRLGRTEIPARFIDIEAIVRGERAENMERKDFTLEERVHIGRALEQQLSRGHGGDRRSEQVEKVPHEMKAREVAATKAGFGNDRTYRQAKEVVEAVEEEPGRFGKLLDDMNRTGRVNGPYKRLRVAKQAERIRAEPPPLPNEGPYRVVVADPPWPYELRQEDPSHRGTHPYPQMSIEQIRDLDVRSIAHDDCILWLWTTNHRMPQAFEVIRSWGFEHKTILTWAKDRMGTGDWLRGQTEHCLMAVRGRPVVELTNQTTVLHAPRRGHSEKPDEFYDLIEKLCPGSRVELFARRRRPGWACHGDEVRAEHAAA